MSLRMHSILLEGKQGSRSSLARGDYLSSMSQNELKGAQNSNLQGNGSREECLVGQLLGMHVNLSKIYPTPNH